MIKNLYYRGVNSYTKIPHVSTYANGQYVLTNEIDEGRKLIKTLESKETVSENDTVFFHSSSKIPRYKFSNYSSGKNIKRVINPEKASTIVVDLGPLNYFYNNARGGRSVQAALLTGEQIKEILPSTDNEVLKNKYGIEISTLNAMKRDLKHPILDTLSVDNYIYFYDKKANTYIDQTNELRLCISKGQKLVSDQTLNKQMSEGQLVISPENFDELKLMLTAKDEVVVKTALELMANSDYTNSVFYISLLLNACRHNDLERLLTTSVNLRNFRDYFADVKWNTDVMSYLKGLTNKLNSSEKMTDEYRDYIYKVALDHINDRLISGSCFEVKEIHFK